MEGHPIYRGESRKMGSRHWEGEVMAGPQKKRPRSRIGLHEGPDFPCPSALGGAGVLF